MILYMAAENYVIVNKDSFPQLQNVNGGLFINNDVLINAGYISDTKENPETEQEINPKSTIKITRNADDTYSYKYFDSDYTNNGYIQNSLALMYDGYNISSNIITDLVGNDDGIMVNFNNGWQGNKIDFDGIDDYLSNTYTETGNALTFQTVIKYQEGSYVIFKNDTDTSLYVADNYLSLNGTNNKITNSYTNCLIYVTVTVNSTETKLYINNELVTTLPGSSTGTFHLFTNSGSSNFKGGLYALRVYDKVLSSDELNSNYNLDMGRYSE